MRCLELGTAESCYQSSPKKEPMEQTPNLSPLLPSSLFPVPPIGSEDKGAWVIRAIEVSLPGHRASTEEWTAYPEG